MAAGDAVDEASEDLDITPAQEWKRAPGTTSVDFLTAQAAARKGLEILSDPAFQRGLADALEAQQRVVSYGLQAIAESIERTIGGLRPGLIALREQLGRNLPPNWIDLGDFEGGIQVAASGWPIIWAPRAEIVARLVAATSDEERDEVLLAETASILDDVLELLRAIAPRGEVAAVDALSEAVEAAQHGLWIACQVIVATVLDAQVTGELKLKYDALQALAASHDPEDITLHDLRLGLIFRSLPAAFRSFHVGKGDPIPKGFSRHATAHTVSYEQLSQRNALFGLLLTTSLLRELHWHGDDQIVLGDQVVRDRRSST